MTGTIRNKPGPLSVARPRPTRTGFTLVEVMVGMSILAIVLAAVVGLVVSTQREYSRQGGTLRAQEMLRTAEVGIGTVLKTARSDPFETGSALLDPDPRDHGAFDNLRVKADFNPADGDFDDPLEDVSLWVEGDTLKVTWVSGGAAEVLAHPVDSLRFAYYRSDGTLIATASQVPSETSRVHFVIGAGKGARSDEIATIESWAYLRNRSGS